MFKIRKFILFLFLFAILYCFTPNLLLPLVKNKIHNYLKDYFKTEVSLEKISINPFTRNIALKKLSIKNSKDFGRGNLLETEEVIVKPKILSFIKNKPAISIIFKEPYLTLHRLPSQKTNWDFFWAGQTGNPLILKELLVKNGTFRYVEESNIHKLAVAELQGIFIYLKRYSITLDHIENVPLHTNIKGRGYFPTEPKGMLYFSGNLNIEQRKPSFLGNINMNNISLTYFKNFYSENSQVKVIQGNFSLTSQTRCIQDQLYAQPEVTVKELRLKLTSDYSTGNIFELPVVLVVDFFDLYKDELKFSFDVEGTLSDPDFQLRDIISQKVSQVIGESIVRTIATSPILIIKLRDKLKGIGKMLKKIGPAIGTGLSKGASTAVKPAEEFMKGLRGK